MRGMTETVTIWHKTRLDGKDVWERIVVPGCSWEADIIRQVSGNTASLASAFVVLCPASLAGRVAVGDLVTKGEHSAVITGVAPNTEPMVRTSLLPEVFTVKTVYDGTSGYKRGGHIELEGV